MANTYSETEILEGLKDIIITALRVDRERLVPDARFFPDLGAESLDVLDIRFRIEEMFQLKFSDGEVIRQLGENLTHAEIEDKFTLQSLFDYVLKRINETNEVPV
jgi:acyl carrier protein